MRGYLALIRVHLKLALRERIVLFFNYVFPLIFFFVFAQMLDAAQGGAIVRVVSMVLVLGVLGNGLFGAGIRAVVERETNVLRRYKVTPISPAPILVASMVTGWLLFLPAILLVLALAHSLYGMEFPARWPSLLLLVSMGLVAFRAMGLIVAAVANSSAESNIVIQLLYLPMLFLSGATFPISFLPAWAQIASQFLPASYLQSGMERVMLRGESLAANLVPLGAMALSTLMATWISMKIFRWEKEEVVPRSAKLWLAAVLVPFLLLGVYQANRQESLTTSKVLDREIRRSRTRLIRGARIFVGDGKVIPAGGILIRNGKIAEVYEGATPDPELLHADVIEASGRTLLPGLIDVHVHLGATGGLSRDSEDYRKHNGMLERHLAAYLYSGVTAVKSVGDMLDDSLRARRKVNDGAYLGAELFVSGPLFTAHGGHGTQYFDFAPRFVRSVTEKQILRLPKTPAEARAQVRDLSEAGIDGIKAVLEGGAGVRAFRRLDVSILRAVAEEARAQSLPLVVHTGDSQDVADAVAVKADGIEHGSLRDAIPAELLHRMAKENVVYDPTLTVVEAFSQLAEGKSDLLARSLVEQVAPPAMLRATRKALQSSEAESRWGQGLKHFPVSLEIGRQNLRRAYESGVTLVAGSDAGNPLVFHGPGVHRELQLWVQAGIPPAAALQAATWNAAKLLGSGGRIGLVRQGYEASLILVDGNPLEDIAATERIAVVLFKGERVDRARLLEQK